MGVDLLLNAVLIARMLELYLLQSLADLLCITIWLWKYLLLGLRGLYDFPTDLTRCGCDCYLS